MPNPLSWPFDTSGFVPRWQCGDWTAALGWAHIVSDLLIAAAYFAIPVLLVYFIRRRRDLPFSRLFWLFGAFIVLCGSTHVLEAVIFWAPVYRLLAVVKALTAAASVATAIALVRAVPEVLRLQSPLELERRVAEKTQELTRANEALRREASERLRAETDSQLHRQWFEVMLASIADGVVATDPNHRISFVNPAAEELTGWTARDAVGRPVEEVVQKSHEDTGEAVETLVARVLRERAAVERSNHTLLTTRSGAQRVIERSAAPIRDATGAVLGVVLVFRDTTEKKRAELALRTSEERFRLIVESVKDHAIYMLSPDGRVTSWNVGAERVFGYTAEEIVDQPFSRFFPPEAVAAGKPDRELEVAREQGSYSESDWRVRKDGGRFWANGVLTAVYHNGGQELRGYVKISRDLTQRYRAEVLLRSVLDNALNGFIGINERGEIETFNTAAKRMFGYSESEVLGRNIAMLMPEPYRSEHDGYIESYLRTGAARIIGIGREVPGRRRDGSTFPASLTVKEFQVEGDPQRHFIGIVRDLTREKEAEAHRSRLIAVLEATPDFVGLFDAAGKCLFLNQAGRAWLGLPAGEAADRARLEDLYPPESLARLRGEAVPTATRQTTWVGETAVRARGAVVPVSQVLVAHKADDGGVQFLSTIMRDLSERNRLEEQFRQSQKMEAVGVLAGGVAHDFNNLLTVILGYGEMLLDRLPAADPSRELIAEMTKSGERAAALTRQLLAFSRKSILAPQYVDLNHVVRELGKMLRRVIGEDVELVTDLDRQGAPVKADVGQLDQVLMNLAVNARDAMPQGGRLTIATRTVVVGPGDAPAASDVQPGRFVRLSVGDTGVGMTDEVKARAFEPFFTTKEKGKGTGLGLAMVYGAVRQAGGYIEVQSAAGRGTTIHIFLPESAEAPATSKPSAPSRPPVPGGETVLLIEDEAGVRSLARLVLEAGGYRVLEAANGPEALAVAREAWSVHLILSDVVLPGESGHVVAERVREVHPEAKILYLSGYHDEAVVRYGVLTEAINFLPKPFTPDGLRRKVREVLAGGG